MADAISVSGPVTGTDKALSFETGKLAGQAGGAVVGRIGDTVVLVTATATMGIQSINRIRQLSSLVMRASRRSNSRSARSRTPTGS